MNEIVARALSKVELSFSLTTGLTVTLSNLG